MLEHGTGLCNATSIKPAQIEARIPAKIKPPTSEASGIPTKFLGSVFGKSLCTKVLRWPPDKFFSTMQMCNTHVSTSTEVVKWPCSMFPTFSWGGFETFEWPNLRWLSSIQPLGQCGYYGQATYPTTVGETQDCSQFNQQITRHYRHDKDVLKDKYKDVLKDKYKDVLKDKYKDKDKDNLRCPEWALRSSHLATNCGRNSKPLRCQGLNQKWPLPAT